MVKTVWLKQFVPTKQTIIIYVKTFIPSTICATYRESIFILIKFQVVRLRLFLTEVQQKTKIEFVKPLLPYIFPKSNLRFFLNYYEKYNENQHMICNKLQKNSIKNNKMMFLKSIPTILHSLHFY